MKGIKENGVDENISDEGDCFSIVVGEPIINSDTIINDSIFDVDYSDNELLQQVVDFYHNTLKQSPDALSVLQKIGIDKSEAIEYFKLGLSDRTLGYRLPEKNRKAGSVLRGRLQRLGILKSSGHELFRGSLVVPVMENGVVNQIYGHKLAKKLRPGTPIKTSLFASTQCLFNIKAIHTCEELIICSTIIDALTFWCAGFKNVTCSEGVDFSSDAISDLFKTSPVQRILIAYAGTKADDDLAKTLSIQLAQMDIESYRIEFSKGMDANTYALPHQPATDCLGEVIRKAVWLAGGKPPDKTIAAESVSANPDLDLNRQDSYQDKNTIDIDSVEDKVIATEEPIAATVLPKPAVEVQAEVKANEIVMCFHNRRYRIRGLENNTVSNHLKVNILVNREEVLHVDTFDLYSARHRDNFCKQSSLELGVGEDVLKKDLSQVLLKLELLQDKNIQQILTPKSVLDELTKQERKEAMHFLTSQNLIQRILDDYERCGVVGEKTNKLVAYLASISRKLPKPLAVIIQSTSAAGKSALMEAVLSFVPIEERVQYSAITGQSLFYMGDINLKHKILAISEEEGANHATYALKLLQSEGQLTIASTGKDPDSGRHVTREYKVEGPVMIFSTTTAIDIDEELLNRCLVLTVDEDRAQTCAIHDFQRFEETLEGLQTSQVRDDIIRIQRNAQQLIKPHRVVNPYARQLTFLDDKTRTRRDHKKYLTLINSISLLHQYQREVKKVYCNGQSLSYVEVTLEDIDLANQLAHQVLGRSLDDLPPQTRRLLTLIDTMVTSHCDDTNMSRGDYRFSRRDVRAYTGWGDTQLKVHIKRLENMEYLLIHRGGRGRQIIYELLYNNEGQDGHPFLMGLIDVNKLDNQSGFNTNLSEASQLNVGRLSAFSHSFETTLKPHDDYISNDTSLLSEKEVKSLIEKNVQQASYHKPKPSNLNGGAS